MDDECAILNDTINASTSVLPSFYCFCFRVLISVLSEPCIEKGPTVRWMELWKETSPPLHNDKEWYTYTVLIMELAYN